MEAVRNTVRPEGRAEVAAYPLDDDLVLFDSGSQEGFLLNGTAALIWKLADGSRKPATIARSVARSFGIPYRRALADVDDFVADLERSGLLFGRDARPGGSPRLVQQGRYRP